MKIRVKNKMTNNDFGFVYEIDDENGKKTEINVAYLDTTLKILLIAEKQVSIRNARAFEKFIINLKRATKYYDNLGKVPIDGPNIMHIRQNKEELKSYREKAIKYDKKAQALFSTHSGWYENLIYIIDEINQVFKETYDDIDSNNELLYSANVIDSILTKYRKKTKQKTL